MKDYIIKKLLLLIPTVLAITFLVFLMMQLIPGDPIHLLLGDMYDQRAADELRHEYGLDQPLIVQYARWLGSLASLARHPLPYADQPRAHRPLHGPSSPDLDSGRGHLRHQALYRPRLFSHDHRHARRLDARFFLRNPAVFAFLADLGLVASAGVRAT